MDILLFTSFLAGVLSVLAPCVLPVLPLLLARGADTEQKRQIVWVVLGLGLSVIAFSIVLKSSTLLIDIPTWVWGVISGGIVTLFGVTMILPQVWEWFVLRTGLFKLQNTSAKVKSKKGVVGDMLLGASLGPIFSVCSPTYALIVATILPASPLKGFIYLLLYVAGLAIMLFIAALGGRTVVKKLGWSMKPNSVFRKILGVILVVFGVMIIVGLDKELLTWLVQNGWYDWQVELEPTPNTM